MLEISANYEDDKIEEELEIEEDLEVKSDEGCDDADSFKEDKIDPFSYYLSDMGKIDLLSVEEEKELWKIIQEFLKKEEELFWLLIDWTIESSWGEKSKNNKKLLSHSQELKKQKSKPNKVRLDLEKNKTKLFKNIRLWGTDLIMDEKDKTNFYMLRSRWEQAIDNFVKANLRLVIKIALDYRGRLWSLNISDLIQEWNIGLLKAVRKFNPEKNENKFSTYAVWWIRQAIISTIQSKSRTIYVPKKDEEKLRNLLNVKKLFKQKNWRFPTNEELAKELKISTEDIIKFLQRVSPLHKWSVLSLDTPVWNDESFTINDKLEDDALNPEQELQARKIKETVNNILSWLNKRERSIMELRFWLNWNEEHTLLEIWKKFGVTREAIRQTQAKIEPILKKAIEKMNIKKINDIFW